MTVADTSLAAFNQVNLSNRQREVLAAIEALVVCSDQDIAAFLGWPINRVTPRRGELVEQKRVVCRGKRIQNNRQVYTWGVRRADEIPSDGEGEEFPDPILEPAVGPIPTLAVPLTGDDTSV